MISRLFLFLTIACCLVSSGVSISFAASSVYFEFAPDAWASKRLIASSGGTPEQLFQVANEFTLTGFNLWLDNTDESGTVTYVIADSQGTTLETETRTIPEMPAVPGGNKIQVNLTNPLAMHAGETYSIKINSSLLGLGIYYADRITFLEHNANFTSEYVNGIARVGGIKQPFTFKFALRTPASTGATTDDSEGISPINPIILPVSISDARVVATTDTTVTLAWTTDIAADSKAAIRSQLSPLYVTAIGYDPTMELEHTLTITGLQPNANYFADVFSSQGAEVTLTTYTIGFKTLTVAAAAQISQNQQPTQSNQNPTPPTQTTGAQSSTQNTTSSASAPATQNSSNSGSNSGTASPGDGATAAGDNLSIGGSGGNTSVRWNAPPSGEPATGYRIDVFDSNHFLERQIKVAPGEHLKNIPKLSTGVHNVVVYAERDGTYTKVAPATSFLVQSNNATMVWKIILVIVLWIVGLGGYFTWKFKKEKRTLPPEEGYDPNR